MPATTADEAASLAHAALAAIGCDATQGGRLARADAAEFRAGRRTGGRAAVSGPQRPGRGAPADGSSPAIRACVFSSRRSRCPGRTRC